MYQQIIQPFITMKKDPIKTTNTLVSEENTQDGRESSRSDPFGCYEAYKELHDVSSVELLRSSILRSIYKKQVTVKFPDKQVQSKPRAAIGTDISDVSLSNIEVKFLERCSSMDSHLQSFQGTNSKQLQIPTSIPVQKESNHQNNSNPVMDVVNSNFWETPEDFPNAEESSDITPTIIKDDNSEIKASSKNDLKLAFRTSSNTIYEDCSTYNINYSEVSLSKMDDLPVKEEHFRNLESCNDSALHFSDRKQLLEDGFCMVGTDNYHNKSDQCREGTDEQTSLCDTFFSTVINGDSAPILDNSTPKSNSKRLSATRKESVLPKEEAVRVADTVDGEPENSRLRKRIRKRNRKNKSNEPHVYECPQCGVSYNISTNMVNDAAYCLHCDLWTSVEPEFLKREKQPWNTCLVC